MGYLRAVRSFSFSAMPESNCFAAFESEFDYLFETLRRFGAALREIEDLAQEVFVVLHRNWSTFDTTRPFRFYLFGVAFRIVCAHRWRRAREIPNATLDVQDGAASPEGSLQSKESIALLLAVFDCVPLWRRVVVVMHDLDGVSVAEIAQRLSITRFGTYARLRKGRKELAAAVRRLLKEGVAK